MCVCVSPFISSYCSLSEIHVFLQLQLFYSMFHTNPGPLPLYLRLFMYFYQQSSSPSFHILALSIYVSTSYSLTLYLLVLLLFQPVFLQLYHLLSHSLFPSNSLSLHIYSRLSFYSFLQPYLSLLFNLLALSSCESISLCLSHFKFTYCSLSLTLYLFLALSFYISLPHLAYHFLQLQHSILSSNSSIFSYHSISIRLCLPLALAFSFCVNLQL